MAYKFRTDECNADVLFNVHNNSIISFLTHKIQSSLLYCNVSKLIIIAHLCTPAPKI